MKIEGTFCTIDQIAIGIFTGYGNDEYGDHWFIEIGLLIFEIRILKYLK